MPMRKQTPVEELRQGRALLEQVLRNRQTDTSQNQMYLRSGDPHISWLARSLVKEASEKCGASSNFSGEGMGPLSTDIQKLQYGHGTKFIRFITVVNNGEPFVLFSEDAWLHDQMIYFSWARYMKTASSRDQLLRYIRGGLLRIDYDIFGSVQTISFPDETSDRIRVLNGEESHDIFIRFSDQEREGFLKNLLTALRKFQEN